jgi:hypothetical protein
MRREPLGWLSRREVAAEVNDVLPTQDMIEHLADRIERAYSLRRPRWWRGCSTRRVWSAAALRLWQAHAEDPQTPLDSELFVASQPISNALSDPWSELTQPDATRRYRSQVQRIIRRLRSELTREVRLAERSIRRHPQTSPAILDRSRRLSPLGCYIAAHRAGRADLADRFVAAAAQQHGSCPLYRPASVFLLAADLYPTHDAHAGLEAHAELRTTSMKLIALN